jgi:hypothetical protein
VTWQQRISPVSVGDKVAYSKAFLRSTGQFTGPVPFARGKVKELTTLGSITLATIEWDHPDCPDKVNVCNLSRVTERGIMDRD